MREGHPAALPSASHPPLPTLPVVPAHIRCLLLPSPPLLRAAWGRQADSDSGGEERIPRFRQNQLDAKAEEAAEDKQNELEDLQYQAASIVKWKVRGGTTRG
jgi:hypothetical protein